MQCVVFCVIVNLFFGIVMFYLFFLFCMWLVGVFGVLLVGLVLYDFGCLIMGLVVVVLKVLIVFVGIYGNW